MLDAAIVGGGPIGSRIAYRLAVMGYRVAVLEKHDGIGQKPCCTGIVSQECVRTFEIPSGVIFNLANSVKIFSPTGESLRISRTEPQAAILNRSAFDCFMAEKAQSQNAEYHLNCRAEHISFLEDRVKIEVLEKGRPCHLEAQAVVLAVGFPSSLFKDFSFCRVVPCVGGAQAEVEANVDEVEIYFDQDLTSGFFAWLVPTSPGRCLAGLLTYRSPGQQLRNWIARLGMQGKVKSGQVAQISHGGVPLRYSSKTYGDRFLVAGDAAGQVKPTTGGGLYFGMLCADIAADTLNDSFQSGDLSSRKLSRYEKQWRKKIGHELDIEYLARRVFEHLSNRQIDRLLTRMKTTGAADALLNEKGFSFDWHGKLMVKALRHTALSQTKRFFNFAR